MDDMEEKLGSILGNPDMMSQIMSMAQKLGAVSPETPPPPPQQDIPSIPQLSGLDMGTLTKIAGMASSTSIDKNEQQLLQALYPYLTKEHIGKLEKAMRATKIAGIASTLLGSGLLSQIGR